MVSVRLIDHLSLSGVLPNLLWCSWISTSGDVTSLTTGTVTVFGACSAEVQLHLVLEQHPEIPCLDPFVSSSTPLWVFDMGSSIYLGSVVPPMIVLLCKVCSPAFRSNHPLTTNGRLSTLPQRSMISPV